MKNIKIVGTGRSLPEKVLTNSDLEKMVDTSDEWIVERTGIRERRIAGDGTATSDLVADAVAKACRQGGVEPAELDAIVVATSTPDTVYPATGCWVQKKLGVSDMTAFDVGAGCSGFLFALEIVANLIATGTVRKAVAAGGEVMSKVVDWQDRATCVLFGDGAGAALCVPGDGNTGILASTWGCDGTLAPLLYQPAGGTRMPTTQATLDQMLHTVHMEGNKVFKHAVRAMSESALKVVAESGISTEEVKLLVPHQANTRIMEATRVRVGIPPEKMYSNVQRYGNMSAATIPVALDEARDEGLIRDGDIVVLTAFGTGFTWGATVLRW